MPKRLGPLPAELQLAPTLAQRVFQLREFRNLTVLDLARQSRFTVTRIEDIEAGLETWLSATDRQVLSKALNVEANILQEVEQRAVLSSMPESKSYSADRIREIARAIINGARDLTCPECDGTLRCSVQTGLDMEGNELILARAFCLKCPFVLHG